ncbi:hypothetical protein O1611_g17 [Lasiodiplodia mahajangana]|uniref:Uncharacterized protein n=1 Tax=Lasiodiplodia mahajangana TaxID=1108764 RepID=A0ACC2K1P5_9PEZI|nr:hypothetical protein O1611_g17 [Lasiodiplodia mahajangana]
MIRIQPVKPIDKRNMFNWWQCPSPQAINRLATARLALFSHQVGSRELLLSNTKASLGGKVPHYATVPISLSDVKLQRQSRPTNLFLALFLAVAVTMEPLSRGHELTQWFGRNGGYLSQAIEMRHSLEDGYHYVARKRPIGPKESVCRCPFGLTLSHLNVMPVSPPGIRNYSVGSACSKLVGNPEIERHTVSIFFLAEQRMRGEDSFWSPYIRVLPLENEMATPLWFNDEEMAYLKGTNLFSNSTPREETSIGLQEGHFRAQWHLGVAELKRAGEPADNFTWELFLWAATVFSSRGFTSDLITTTKEPKGSFPILYPVLDVFNHHTGAKVRWQFCEGDYDLYLEEKVDQGQQIFNNYSPKGNEDLLMGFGFCIPDNPYDQVAVRLGQVQPNVYGKLHESIPSHWQSKTWEPEESIFYLQATSRHSFGRLNVYGDSELSCLRRIPFDLAKSVQIILLERNKLSGLILGEQQAWAGAINVLLHQMEHALMGITRWDRELPDSPCTSGAKAAWIYRAGQVKILQEVISDLKTFAGNDKTEASGERKVPSIVASSLLIAILRLA